MTIITILVVLGIVGVALYFLYQAPIPPWVKHVATAIAIVFVLVWLLQSFGLMGSIESSVPKIK